MVSGQLSKCERISRKQPPVILLQVLAISVRPGNTVIVNAGTIGIIVKGNIQNPYTHEKAPKETP
jgi:hypothetical protein